MRRLVLMTMCVAMLALSASATGLTRPEAEQLFAEANDAYAQEDYAGALDAYRRLMAGGFATREVLGNAGNAAVQLDDIGSAVLYYSRALRVDPGYSRARENLFEIQPTSNLAGGDESFLDLAGEAFARTPGWLWLGVAELAFVLMLLALILAARSPAGSDARGAWASRLAAAAIACVVGFGLVVLHGEVRRVEGDAVVLGDGTITRSGPGERFPPTLELPAGTLLMLPQAPREGWAAFRLVDGRSGYIATSAIEPL